MASQDMNTWVKPASTALYTVRSAKIDPDGRSNKLTLVVHNVGGKDCSVVINGSDGDHDTGHIRNGSDGGLTVDLGGFVGRANKIVRWAPGFGGFWGDGGGELWLSLGQDQDGAPIQHGDALLEIDVNNV